METVESVLNALENAPRVVVPLLREVPEAILKRRPSLNKWSAHEHACHLAAVHPVFFSRLELMLSNSHPTIEPYFPDKTDADDALLKMNLDESLKSYERDRQTLVKRLKELNENEWQRTAEHGEYNRYSVFIMFRHLALHDFLHTYRIEELLLKNDW